MRIKAGLLLVLTVSLGTALAMSAAERDDTSSDVVGSVTKDTREPGSTGGIAQDTDMHFDLSAIKRPTPKHIRTTGLFDTKSWYKPPIQSAPAYVPPPQPTIPALPFTFVGRMIDRNVVTLFLSRNDRQYTVKENDVLDDTYRIEKIGESDAVLTYMPTNTQQTLLFHSTLSANSLISSSDLNATMHPAIPTQQSSPTN